MTSAQGQHLSIEKAEATDIFHLTHGSNEKATVPAGQSWCRITTVMLPKHTCRYHTKLSGKAVCLSADLGEGEHSCQDSLNWCLNPVLFEPFVWYVPFSILPIIKTTEVLAYFQTLSKLMSSPNQN